MCHAKWMQQTVLRVDGRTFLQCRNLFTEIVVSASLPVMSATAFLSVRPSVHVIINNSFGAGHNVVGTSFFYARSLVFVCAALFVVA